MTFRLGLTGSIGTGKTTTARIFARHGCDVWDADAAVHRLYGPGGAAVAPVGRLVPEALTPEGGISREVLREKVTGNPELLRRIEEIVHPLVRADREAFLARSDADIVVFDIPLLFETGAEKEMDAVACVTVPAEIQRKRVLERGTMSPEQLDAILARQMPAGEKCRRADYVIVTDTPEHAEEQVARIVADIRERMEHARDRA